MRKILIFFPLFLLLLSAKAQVNDFDIFRGTELRDHYKLMSKYLAFDNSGNSYMLYHPGHGNYNYIQRYDSNLMPAAKEKVNLWIEKKMRDFEYFGSFHDSLYLFSSSPDLWLNYNRLAVQTIDPITLKASALRKILEIENFKNQFSEFYYTFSADRSKLMVCNYTDVPLRKMVRLHITVFDKGMKKLWQSERILEGVGRFAYLMQTEVDNNGNVFLLMSLYKQSIWNMGAELKNQVGVISFTQQGNHFGLHRIDFPDLYIRDTKIVALQNGNVFCAGLFSTTMVNGFAKGRFSTTIDPKKEKMVNTVLEEFNAVDVQGIISEKALENGRELFNFHIDTLLLRPDSGILMVIEQEYVDYIQQHENPQARAARMRGYYVPPTQQNETIQHKKFNDIFLIKLAANGTTEWTPCPFRDKILNRSI
jgi:hypothetical protein